MHDTNNLALWQLTLGRVQTLTLILTATQSPAHVVFSSRFQKLHSRSVPINYKRYYSEGWTVFLQHSTSNQYVTVKVLTNNR